MIAELKPYADYAATDMPWANRVPSHWGKRRTKFLFRERVQKGFPEEPLLAATQNMGVVRKTDYGERTVTAMKDFHLLKLVEPGDFVISLRSFQGGLEIAHYRGIISPAYTILEPRQDASRGYFRHFFKSPYFIRNLTLFVTGIREGQNIDYERLSRAYLPLPPVEEQNLMARFLDHANGRLERAIRAKRKVIALLNEQKQAIIHRAVTRGLDPAAPLKSSGIPWLGDIPAHWDVKRNSRLFDERLEKGRSGLPLLIVSLRTGVTEGSEIDEDGRPKRLIAEVTGYKFARQGDIAYNMMRMWQGAVGVVPMDGLVSPAYVVAKPRPGVASSYYELLFRTDGCKNEINRNSRGIVSDRNRLYWDQFKKLYLPFPSLEEQHAIVAHIGIATADLNAAITRLEREIALLREYRTRLVADVVTGQLDVCLAAARLPNDPSEVGACDKLSESTESDGEEVEE